jgi:hypothetical protein
VAPHLVAENHVDRELLVMGALRQHSLGSVRERDVAEVMAECAHADDGAPVIKLLVRRKEMLNFRMTWVTGDDIEDATREIHHAEAMFEAPMRGTWVNEICESELVNVSQALEGSRVDHSTFI